MHANEMRTEECGYDGQDGFASRDAGWRVHQEQSASYGMLLSLFAIMLFFQIVTDGTLLQAAQSHQSGAAEQLYRDHGARHAAGDRHRHIDLSVGSVAGFVGAVARC